MNIQQHCDEMNRNLEARGKYDLMWVPGPTGPFLTDHPGWSAAHTIEIERNREEERQRYNHRMNYPIADMREAAE